MRLLLLKVAYIWDYLRSISTVTSELIRGNAGLHWVILIGFSHLLQIFVIVAVVNGHAIVILNFLVVILLIQDAAVIDGLVVFLYWVIAHEDS